METTKRASRANCLAAARRKWGKRAYVRENKNAMTPAERAAHHEKVAAARAERDRLEKERVASAVPAKQLLEKAEFFLAVNGDEPSGTEFRAAVAAARKHEDLCEQYIAARDEWMRIRGGGTIQKWDAGHVSVLPGLGDCVHCRAQADTLDELLAKIEGATP